MEEINNKQARLLRVDCILSYEGTQEILVVVNTGESNPPREEIFQ